jgi:conjugative relaxase-like TrwC/TraI family protein
MLSIGKLANHTGKAAGSYYLDSVAKGRDDYYVGRGEAEGRWMGTGLMALQLSGEVASGDFLAVVAGRNPTTGEWLGREPRGGQRTPGFDLTFSAPKSVSVLWGLAGESVSEQVQEAHDVAVAAAMRFVEERVAFTRRGYLGARREGTTGLIVGAFRHRCSRAGDPALHTHCVVANVVLGGDGKWSALDARLLYAWGKTAGYLYQFELRKELVKRLGVEWGEANRGTSEIEGVEPEVCRAFSKRREEIERRMEAMGETSAKAAQIATLDTRKSKEYGVDGATLHDGWRARGLQLGMTVEGLEAVTGRDRYRSLNVTGRREIAERLSSATGLTQRASTFGQREVIQAWCDQLRQGGDVAEVLKLASFYLASPQHVVPVGKATELRGTDVIRREDGKTVAAQTDEYRFSTPEMLETERRLVAAAVERSGTGVAVATAGAVARAIENRPYLSDEQARMVTTVASGGDGVVLVVGRPGAGKTTALGACREAWEASGHRVVGCALAAETARTLQRESGIASYTVTQLMADISDPEHGGLARNSVVVVDEAAMVGTRQLAPLLEAAQRGGAKVVLVGDDHQLPEIDAGGAFRGLRDRTTSVELIENRRQREAWERNALERLRSGDVARAIAEYQGRDAVVVGANADEVRRQLVQDWWTARQQATDAAAQPVIIAARHVDVDRLNDQARAMRKAGGELGEASLEIAGREFAAGDRVVTMKNARGLGVRNGTRGTVTEIDQDKRRLTVRTDDGVDVELPESYTARRLRHAYALTGHKAQGKTVTRAFVLADDATYREWAYTALSRGQEANRLYVVRRESQLPDDVTHGTERIEDPLRPMVRSLDRSAAQTMAIDSADRAEVDRLEGEAANLTRLRDAQRQRAQQPPAPARTTLDEERARRRRRSRRHDRDQSRGRDE